IVGLLAKDADLPQNVRFLMTSRDEPRVKEPFSNRNFRAFDLIEDAASSIHDVQLFAYERLAGLREPTRTELALKISELAAGVFLYAYMALQQLMPNLSPDVDVAALDLPKDLVDLYRRFLARELTADTNKWSQLYGPLLGILAVAQGEGLRRDLLELIIGEEEVTEALLKCKQYLTGDLPHGPFRIFHRSFVEFLLDKTKNLSRPLSAVAMHRRIVDYYWQTFHGDWSSCATYALTNLALHLFEGKQFDRLAELISQPWMEARFAGSGYIGFLDDLNLAWEAIANRARSDQILTLLPLIRFRALREAVTLKARAIYTDDLL